MDLSIFNGFWSLSLLQTQTHKLLCWRQRDVETLSVSSNRFVLSITSIGFCLWYSKKDLFSLLCSVWIDFLSVTKLFLLCVLCFLQQKLLLILGSMKCRQWRGMTVSKRAVLLCSFSFLTMYNIFLVPLSVHSSLIIQSLFLRL